MPSFKAVWDSVPQSSAPRTLDAAIAFLDQLDDAVDRWAEDPNISVWEALDALVHELHELGTHLKTLKTEIDGNAAGRAR